MTQRPFDPTDPFDRSSEELRAALARTFIEYVSNNDAYASLTDYEQIHASIIGFTVALAGCLAACVADDTRPALQTSIVDFLPKAFAFADELAGHNGKSLQ